MTEKYDLYFNITYQCNCACLFCASDMTTTKGKEKLTIGFEDYKEILERFPEGPDTLIAISGGEPTIHKDIKRIVRFTRERGHFLNIFSNGRRFSSRSFSEWFVENFKGTLLVPVYTTDAKLHDILTGCPGSFDETMSGLNIFESLRCNTEDILLQIKLLFFNTNKAQNLNTFTYVLELFPAVDCISFHSFIDSQKARQFDFVPSLDLIKQELGPILETISERNLDPRMINFSDMPPCLFSPKEKLLYNMSRLKREDEYIHIYFDPLCIEGEIESYDDDATCANCHRCDERSECRYLR